MTDSSPCAPEAAAAKGDGLKVVGHVGLHAFRGKNVGGMVRALTRRSAGGGIGLRAANKTPLASLSRLVVLLVLPAAKCLARAASLSFVSRS